MKQKYCLQCKKLFSKPLTMSVNSWNNRAKFCSKKCKNQSQIGKPAWNKGKECDYLLGNTNGFKKGQISWMEGKHHKEETKRKISEKLKKFHPSQETRRKRSVALSGDKCYLWKGGITKKSQKIRSSLEYKLWREAVFERDDWTCLWCSKKGARLNADHIKPFSLYPQFRFDINNGRTLCVDCHKTTDTYLKNNLGLTTVV